MRALHPRPRQLATFAGVAAFAAVTAACGSSSSGTGASGGSTPTSSSAGSSTSSAPGTSSGSGSGSSSTVTAVETEFKIALSSTTLKAGTYTFVADNKGDDTHALEIDGPGVDDKATGDISPGSSQRLTVTLRAGKYDVYCPVANHKSLGMNDEVTVT